MNKTKTIMALHLMAIVVAAGVAVMAEEKVFAQPSSSQNTVNSQTTDPKDQPDKDNLQQDDQTNDNPADNQDGETNDDHNSASEGPNGDGDGEQKDTTESGK